MWHVPCVVIIRKLCQKKEKENRKKNPHTHTHTKLFPHSSSFDHHDPQSPNDYIFVNFNLQLKVVK